jgi:hypothetical protein
MVITRSKAVIESDCQKMLKGEASCPFDLLSICLNATLPPVDRQPMVPSHAVHDLGPTPSEVRRLGPSDMGESETNVESVHFIACRILTDSPFSQLRNQLFTLAQNLEAQSAQLHTSARESFEPPTIRFVEFGVWGGALSPKSWKPGAPSNFQKSQAETPAATWRNRGATCWFSSWWEC